MYFVNMVFKKSTSINFAFIKSVALVFYIGVALVASPAFAEGEAAAPNLKDVMNDVAPADAKASNTTTTKATKEGVKKLVKVGPDDEFNRGVPRTSVAGYFSAVKEGDYKRAAKYLDLRHIAGKNRDKKGQELARQLQVVLDRSLWVEMDLLSLEPKGHSDDGLPANRDLVGQIELKKKKYDILLQRVPRGNGVYIWKFSSKTVRVIPKLHNEYGYGPIGERLSKSLPIYELFGLQIWQWIFLLFIVLVATLITLPFIRLTSRIIRRKKTPFSLMLSRFINGPVNIVLVIILVRQNFELIHPSLVARALFDAGTIFILVFIWLILRLVGLLREYWTAKLLARGQESTVVLLRPAMVTLKIIIVFIGLLVWLDNIGFSVTTILAGMGIGGIAVALATQKSIENFIGALTLYMAAPVKVGDFCRFGGEMGVVEEIGLRATKIRTLENTAISIPNAEFAGQKIENLTERQRYRFNPKIRLQMSTSPDQLRFILLEFKKLLYAHSMVAESPLRARFIGFGEHSLDIEIHCYVETVDVNVYLGVAEDLNLRMMDIINLSGTRIAIPAVAEYQSKLDTPDADARQQAELHIDKLRDKGTITTELTDEQIAQIKNTIPYPA